MGACETVNCFAPQRAPGVPPGPNHHPATTCSCSPFTRPGETPGALSPAQRGILFFTVLLALLWARTANAAAPDVSAEFDRANKFYEQGKFLDAVISYQSLARTGAANASVWFNLGNAAYKSGQMGRAIAAYRQAERLNPRDSSLRANLQFVRGKVYSDERTRVPFWKSALCLATLNEWAALAALSFWVLFSILALGELTGRRHPKAALSSLLAVLFSGVALATSVEDQRADREAIVSAREVTARVGPLDESQSAFQLRDGAEVTVLDAKGDWLQVRDAEKRTGWMRRDDALVLPGAFPSQRR